MNVFQLTLVACTIAVWAHAKNPMESKQLFICSFSCFPKMSALFIIIKLKFYNLRNPNQIQYF